MALHGFNRRLRWSDFTKVRKSLDGEHDASTFTEISARYSYIRQGSGNWKLTRVSVTVAFNSTKSWVVIGKESKDLLNHEQMHYNIAAIAGRELEGKLAGLKGDASQSPDDAVTALSRDVIGEQDADGQMVARGALQDVQDRYDEDLTCGSEHGLNRHYQISWEHRVTKAHGDRSAMLDQLNSCPREQAGAAHAGE